VTRQACPPDRSSGNGPAQGAAGAGVPPDLAIYGGELLRKGASRPAGVRGLCGAMAGVSERHFALDGPAVAHDNPARPKET